MHEGALGGWLLVLLPLTLATALTASMARIVGGQRTRPGGGGAAF
jgi:hypothetical protein